MKRLSILIVMVFGTLLSCYAATSELKTTSFQPLKPPCTVSVTVYEQVTVVCEGGNVLIATAAATCTKTAINCTQAFSDANTCASGALVPAVNTLRANLIASCVP